MDKKTARGLIRLKQRDCKKLIKYPSNGPKSNEQEHFEINTNDFPSLSEVFQEKEKFARSSLDSSRSSFSYSDKLKSTPQESREIAKTENISENLFKHGYETCKEHFSKNKAEPLKPNRSHKQTTAILKSDKSNKISSQEESKEKFITFSDRCHDKHSFEKKLHTHESANKKGTTNPKTDKQHLPDKNGTFFKTPDKRDCIAIDANVPKYSKPRDSSLASSQINNKKPSTSMAKALQVQINKEQFHIQTKSAKIDISANNSINASHCSSQINTVNTCERTKVDGQGIGTKLDPASDVKKKKKRKSKIKRQTAMQTGKIFVLTPEAHSKIVNQTKPAGTQVQNLVIDINDSNEYPELGTTIISKVNKENSSKTVKRNLTKEILTKTSKGETNIAQIESNFEVSEKVSQNVEIIEAACVQDSENNKEVETITKEKSVIHAKDAITISLFDMLWTAKSKRKESEKKNDAKNEASPSKISKHSSKISAKKATSQFVNPLDSSRPAVKRGKEREKPKVKKPSRMRKLILMGRKLRKEELEMEDENLVDKPNNLECDTHSGDDLSPIKGTEFDKDVQFVELCAGSKIALAAFNDNEELEYTMSLTEMTENPGSLNENYQDVCELHDNLFQNCKDDESDNFSSDFGTATTTTLNNESSSHVETNDSFNFNYKKGVCLKTANEISPITVSQKSHVSKRLAARFSVERISSHEDCDKQFLNNEESDECIFDEAKYVLEDLLSLVTNEDQYLMPLEIKNNMSIILSKNKTTEDCEFKSNSLETEVDVDSIKSEYYSFSENNIDNREILHSEEVFFSATESPITNLNSIEKENSFNISLIDGNCQKENEIGDISAVSAYNKNSLVKSLDSSVFCENESTLTDSSKSDIFPVAESYAKLISDEIVPYTTISTEQVDNNSTNLFSDQEKYKAVKTLIHTRKFRQYCNHFVNKEIDTVVFTLLDDLARFQDRMHQKDPVKARVRKRLLYGIKEITRHMKLKKLKGVILATDIEDIKTEGGLNDVVKEIISLAEAYHIPYIFSHRRFNLGKVCRKAVPVSCVGIFNYEGSEKNFKRAIELQLESKQEYIIVTNTIMSILTNEQIEDIFKLSRGVPEKLYEFRIQILKNHFLSDVKQNKDKSTNSDLPTSVEFARSSAIGQLENSGSDANPKNSTMILNHNLNSSVGSNTATFKELNKNEVHDILKKYNLV